MDNSVLQDAILNGQSWSAFCRNTNCACRFSGSHKAQARAAIGNHCAQARASL